MNDMNEQIFKNIGLAQKESRVLLALIELNSAKLSELGKKVGLPRTSLYPILHKLSTRGLVHEARVENHKEWQAVPPKEIYRQAKEALKSLEAALPELQNLTDLLPVPKKQSEILYYKSEAGVKRAMRELLRLKPTERVYGIEGGKTFDEKWLKEKSRREYILKWQMALKKSKIIPEIIFSEKVVDLFKKMDLEMLKAHADKMLIAHALSEELMDFDIAIYAFRETLMIASFGQNLAIFINNSEIVKVFKILFNIVRQSAKKIDFNAYIQDQMKIQKE